MKMKMITLKKGYALIPRGIRVINLSEGKGIDAGVIVDGKEELPDLVVVADRSLVGMSVQEEEDIVNRAVKDLPLYKEALASEIPFPSIRKDMIAWNNSRRLYFCPFWLQKTYGSKKYQIFGG